MEGAQMSKRRPEPPAIGDHRETASVARYLTTDSGDLRPVCHLAEVDV